MNPLVTISRSKWRKAVEDLPSIKLVFLIAEARTVGQQVELVGEEAEFRDIVQSSVPDGHRLLAYKILMG